MKKMSEEERAQMKEWVERWKRVGPILERIKREELRRFRYEDSWHIADELLEMGCRFGTPRTTTGLVEQQRLFAKARK